MWKVKLKRLLEYVHLTKVSKLHKDDLKSKGKAQKTQVRGKKKKEVTNKHFTGKKTKKHKTNENVIPFIPIQGTKI